MEETFHYPEGDEQTNGWTKKEPGILPLYYY
jgi:hypothetical protein